MLLVFLKDNDIYYLNAEPGDKITIGSGKKDSLSVPDLDKKAVQVFPFNIGAEVSSKKYSLHKKRCGFGEFCVLDKDRGMGVCVYQQLGYSDQTLRLPYNCTVRLGRTPDCNVIIANKLISHHHCVIRSENGTVRVENESQTNGTYLNGKKITKALLRPGDVISVMNIRLHFEAGCIKFENVGADLKIRGIDEEAAFAGDAPEKGSGNPEFQRSPRIRQQMPSSEIVLSQPPSKPQKLTGRRGMWTSMVSSGGMVASSLAMGMSSPALMAARAASLLPMMSSAFMQGGGKERKKELEQYTRARMEKYGVYIDGEKARIQATADIQREIILRENPAPVQCVKVLADIGRTLWERRASDNDFLDVRIGEGYDKLCVNVKSFINPNNFEMESDELRELAEYVIEETRIVDNVPARIQLRRHCTVGFIGQRARIVSMVKNMLIALTTAHCYEDVQIVGLFDESEKSTWEALRWLPHVWDENRQFRYLGFDKKSVDSLCDLFHDSLKARRDNIGESSRGGLPTPHYVFIIGSPDCVSGKPLLDDLLTNSPQMGVTTLFLYNIMPALPHDCRYIVDVDDHPMPSAYDCDEVNNKILFTPDTGITPAMFDFFARNMSAVELTDAAVKNALPNSLTFLQGYAAATAGDLKVRERWENSRADKSLAAPIGVTVSGKTFCFDVVKHGPHGLVAGTTGSGKSELLQSWILSVAVNYHPYDVNFVIIDYKGGGMANLLEGLPHVVGKITNIGSNINRSMLSLHSELSRRQRLFAEAGVNKISDYQAAYKSGRVKEPLPRLVIVADEFAELKKQEPDFMKSLISAARIGRSLGVHLVLATQKPGGVVDDQINSNSSFRICLKVQNAADSREMLARPDAAKLTDPGRAYVRVGDDDIFELVQSYWSGAPYLGAASAGQEVGNQSRIVDISGNRIKTIVDEKTRFKSDVDELKAISNHINKVAGDMGIQKLPGPWLPELPEKLLIGQLGCPGGFDGREWKETGLEWLQIPIGMFDAPEVQEQGMQVINLASEGHYGIYGAPTTGKTTLLKTVIASACSFYTPSDVNVYILDFGGWNMVTLKSLPHVGDVILDCEAEKFAKFMEMITEEFERRKKILFAHTVSSLTAYRAAVAKDIPAIIIAVDNIVPMFDLYPDAENLFVQIGREGASYGIYLVYTANSSNGVKFKLMQNIRGAVAFELTDKCDYAGIVGKVGGASLPPITGRAFFKGAQPVVFQAALYADGGDDVERAAAVTSMGKAMTEAWKGEVPKRMPVMPENVTAEDMSQAYTVRTYLPFGMAYDKIEPAGLNLEKEYCAMVAGSVGCGKSTLLCRTARMIHDRVENSKIFVFDGSKKSMASVRDIAEGYAAVTDQEQTTAALGSIIEMLNTRKRAQNAAREQQGEGFDEKAYAQSLELACVFIDDVCEYTDTVDKASVDSMERIVRLAEGLGIIVAAAGRTANLIKYSEIERLTRAILAGQKGLALSDSAAAHPYFKNSLKFGEKDAEFGDGNGMLFDGASSRKIKLAR